MSKLLEILSMSLSLLGNLVSFIIKNLSEGILVGVGGGLAVFIMESNIDVIRIRWSLLLGRKVEKWAISKEELTHLKRTFEPKFKITANPYCNEHLFHVIIDNKLHEVKDLR